MDCMEYHRSLLCTRRLHVRRGFLRRGGCSRELSGPVGASLTSCFLVIDMGVSVGVVVVLIATLDFFVVTGGKVSGADTGVAVVGGDAVEFCDVAIVHRVVSVSAVIICL